LTDGVAQGEVDIVDSKGNERQENGGRWVGSGVKEREFAEGEPSNRDGSKIGDEIQIPKPILAKDQTLFCG
jgi:hypothetical protein